MRMEKKNDITPKPTVPNAEQQPVSVHYNAASHWSMFVAAIGIPVLALIVVSGLFLLPEVEETRVSEDAGVEDEQSVNPRTPVATMRLMTVKNAEERGAVCNDGSPAKYYFRPGTEENKDKWVIYFKGGGGCGTEETCLKRAEEDEPGLMSSNPYSMTIREDGILSPNPSRNEDFYNWNHVKMMYCSSDNWAGEAEQTIGGETWYFHGKAITDAIIDDLQNDAILETATLREATLVLIGGSSAGGGGAANNLDDIAHELEGAEVKGFIDSSWSYEIEDPYIATADFETLDRTEISHYHNKQLDDTCVAALGEDAATCTHLAVVYPYLETPTFIFMNQYDNLKLENLGVKAPIDETEQAWLDTVFVPGLLDSYEVVDDGLFSPKETFHTLLTSSLYYTTELDGVTVQEAFTNWFFERPGPTYLVEE